MSKIVLSTSSSCLDLLNIKHNIKLIPLHVKINGVDFIDGKNINPTRLAQIMKDNPTAVAKTSPPTIEEVTQYFLDLYKKGYTDIFLCCLSSQFSQSYEVFHTVRQSLLDKLNIYIYDTKTLNLNEGALAYEADCLLQEGKSFTEIANALDRLRETSSFLFTLYDLNYIIQNQKLSAPAGFFANLFDIKPLMEINQAGNIVAKNKVRKMDNALEQLGRKTLEFIQDEPSFIYLSSAGYQEDVEYFSQILSKKLELHNLPIISVSSISLANHGPRGVGIGAFAGEIPKIAKFFM